jgi:hypothetical protein
LIITTNTSALVLEEGFLPAEEFIARVKAHYTSQAVHQVCGSFCLYNELNYEDGTKDIWHFGIC